MAEERLEPFLVFVLGAPGSGKGTICKRLSQDFGFFHFSYGDHLRKLGGDPTAQYHEITASYLRGGPDLPAPVTIHIVTEKIKELREKGERFILIDGFPRDSEQARGFWKNIQDNCFVISFICPKIIQKQRYLTRKHSGRLDDDENKFEKRFAKFESNFPGVMDLCEYPVEELDSSSGEEETYARLLEGIGKRYGWKPKDSIS